MALLLAVAAFLSLSLPVLAIALALGLHRKSARARLASVEQFQRDLLSPIGRRDISPGLPLEPAAGPLIAMPAPEGLRYTVSAWLSQSTLGRWCVSLARRDLDRTVWTITPAAYLLRRLLVFLNGLALGWLLTQSWVGLVLGSIVSQVVWDRCVVYLITRYRRQIARQSEQVIEILTAHLRAGHSLVQSLTALADEAPSPSREEYRRVVRQLSLGAPASEALRSLQERVPIESVSLLVSALNLNRRIGGDLPMLLRIAADTIRDQIRLREELSTTVAGQVMASYVVLALPAVLFVAMFFIDRPYLNGLLQPGWNLLLVAGGIMEVLGYFIMRSFTRVEL